jgi:hypothetical protein
MDLPSLADWQLLIECVENITPQSGRARGNRVANSCMRRYLHHLISISC